MVGLGLMGWPEKVCRWCWPRGQAVDCQSSNWAREALPDSFKFSHLAADFGLISGVPPYSARDWTQASVALLYRDRVKLRTFLIFISIIVRGLTVMDSECKNCECPLNGQPAACQSCILVGLPVPQSHRVPLPSALAWPDAWEWQLCFLPPLQKSLLAVSSLPPSS